jgi:hypothetical protein
VSGQRSAFSGQRSAVNVQLSAFSDQHSAFSAQRSAFSVQRSAFSVQRSAFSDQRSAVSGQRSAVSVQRSAFSVQRSAFSVQRSAISGSAISVQQSAFSDQRSAFSVQQSAFSDQRSAISVQRSAFTAQRSASNLIYSFSLAQLQIACCHNLGRSRPFPAFFCIPLTPCSFALFFNDMATFPSHIFVMLPSALPHFAGAPRVAAVPVLFAVKVFAFSKVISTKLRVRVSVARGMGANSTFVHVAVGAQELAAAVMQIIPIFTGVDFSVRETAEEALRSLKPTNVCCAFG